MFSLTDLIVVAVIAGVIGLIAGAYISHLMSPQGKKSKNLENQLKSAEQKLTGYQQEVTEHFSRTAKLVNNLTESYKEVHEHLAGDALKLANVDISRQLMNDNKANDILGESTIADGHYQAPRDWAPKTAGSEGPLSESYGLDDGESTETDHTKTH